MKKIILSGSTGFIGNHINGILSQTDDDDINLIDLRKTQNEIVSEINHKTFDIFIHSAGIHPTRENSNNDNIIKENNLILEKVEEIFKKSKKIILISSFVNLIDYSNNIITESNLLKLNKFDNSYKISKYHTEIFFLNLKKKYKKELIIIYPCHVIGPKDKRLSPNVSYIKSITEKSINFYFDIYYPVTDVREISNYIHFIINKDLNSHKKIILTKSIKMIDLIKRIKKKYSMNIRLFKFYGYFFVMINFFLNKFFFINKNFFSISTLKFIKLDPKIISKTNNKYLNKYVVDETITDTLSFFKNHE